MYDDVRERIVNGMLKRLEDDASRRKEAPKLDRDKSGHAAIGTAPRARINEDVVRDENGKTATDYLVADDVGHDLGGGESVVDAVRRDRKESGAASPVIPSGTPTNSLGQPFAIFRHSSEFTEAEDVVIVNGLLAHLPLYIIAEKLHCARHILSKHIKESPLLQQVWEDREESLLDHVEFQAKRLVDSGNPAMIMYWLERKGKSRGWSQDKTMEVTEDDTRIVIGEIPEDTVMKAEAEMAQITADANGSLSAREVAERLSAKGSPPDPMTMAIQESEIQRMQDAEDDEGPIVETDYDEPQDVMSDVGEFGGGAFNDGGGFWG